jgi:hypothetical protein
MAKKVGKGVKVSATRGKKKPAGPPARPPAGRPPSPWNMGIVGAMTSDTISEEGLLSAAQFFDKVETNEGLQAALTVNNGNVVTLAATMGFSFNYAEMSAHLRARWKTQNGPKERYCTF